MYFRKNEIIFREFNVILLYLRLLENAFGSLSLYTLLKGEDYSSLDVALASLIQE